MKINWKQKLSSRKFWVAVSSIVAGLMVIIGSSDGDVEAIAGAIIAVGGAVAYIITEGKIDAQRVALAIEAIQVATEEVADDD